MATEKLFRLLGSRARTLASTSAYINEGVRQRNADELETLCKEFMPSGSGFDSGTTLDVDSSNSRKLVFVTGFHHMDDAGGYDGWTHHKVVVTAEFDGLDIRVTGRDRNSIKEYIGETFYSALHQMIDSVWSQEDSEHSFSYHKADAA